MVNRIQNELQELQRSGDGYQVAGMLMKHSSRNCQFFGALTYAVVINSMGPKLEIDKLEVLVREMEGHICAIVRLGETEANMFIIRKLFSNLSLVFISNHETYSNPVESLLRSLCGSTDLAQIVGGLQDMHLMVLLMFSSVIVEDISKQERSAEIHAVVESELYRDLIIIYDFLNSTSRSVAIDSLALDCLNSWVTYISVAECNSQVRYTSVETLITFLFNHFLTQQNPADDEVLKLINKAVGVVTEILEINPRMLTPEMKSYLDNLLFESQNWGAYYIDTIILGEAREMYLEEIDSFINLLITFLQNDILKLSKSIMHTNVQYKIKTLVSLTNFPGTPIEDESVSDQFLAFWEEFINIYVDDIDTFEAIFLNAPNDRQSFFSKRDEIINDVCSIYWNKIHLPELNVLEANKLEFLHYRTGVSDLFIAGYSLLSVPFYEKLTHSITVNILETDENPTKIIDIESTLYLLFKITEDCTFYESQSSILIPYVDSLFESRLLDVIKLYTAGEGIYRYVYSTFVNFLSSIQFYLKGERGSRYLGTIFDLLFSIVFDGPQSLSLNTSRTILKICQECRESLTSFLPNLEVLLVEMLKNLSVDGLIRQRMFNAYTSIAQCLKEPSKFSDILKRMITAIHNRALEVMNSLPQLNENEEDYLLSLLSCVCEVGRACEIPEEVDDFYNEEQKFLVNQYWIEDPMQVKDLNLSIVKTYLLNYAPIINNTTCTEKCCLILKAGIREPIEGPFKFPMDTIFNFILAKIDNCNIDSVPYLYGLIETVVIVNHKFLDQEIVGQLVKRVFTDHIDFLKSDPYTINSAIELFATILERNPSLIVSLPVFENVIVGFAIDGLKAHEAFIIKSILKFWVALIALKKGTKENQDFIRSMMVNTNLGTLFVFDLLKAFLGTPRSNLDHYYPIFRNLITKYPIELKKWLQVAFRELKNSKLDEKNIDALISRIMATRGQRSANDILKKIWLQLNGLIEFNSRSF